ncbi:MAG TPA: pyridoxamine 5'-phosphate oxidase family protein [Acidimicrobiales bacterium]|nr:pyridoxamine 5'-phosphate oxidase family protein [Acidimicrobiales bacterium]|tara:strand:+ start:2707 stop:3354 length:648 start_codon:yes stop_codon:yes gene_type:complete
MSDRSTIKRKPERGVDEKSELYAVLDEGLVAHVGIICEDEGRSYPLVIPMFYARQDDQLLLHGSVASRLLRQIKKGVEVCVEVTLLDAIVLARAAVNISMNYRSVVIFGNAQEIVDHEKKAEALDLLVEHGIPGRMKDVRANTEKEVKATTVLTLSLEEYSMKARTGPPIDDFGDFTSPAWAGVIPLGVSVGEPEPELSGGERSIPSYVSNWRRG